MTTLPRLTSRYQMSDTPDTHTKPPDRTVRDFGLRHTVPHLWLCSRTRPKTGERCSLNSKVQDRSETSPCHRGHDMQTQTTGVTRSLDVCRSVTRQHHQPGTVHVQSLPALRSSPISMPISWRRRWRVLRAPSKTTRARASAALRANSTPGQSQTVSCCFCVDTVCGLPPFACLQACTAFLCQCTPLRSTRRSPMIRTRGRRQPGEKLRRRQEQDSGRPGVGSWQQHSVVVLQEHCGHVQCLVGVFVYLYFDLIPHSTL